MDKTKEEFESIERPLLDIESPSRTSFSRSSSLKFTPETPLSDTVLKQGGDKDKESRDSKKEGSSTTEKEDAAKNQLELELDDGEEFLPEEINDWEFDALDDTDVKTTSWPKFCKGNLLFDQMLRLGDVLLIVTRVSQRNNVLFSCQVMFV